MPKIILVVSSNPLIRDFCRQYLGPYNLKFCSDWDKLYNTIKKNIPSLILFDYSFFISTNPQLLEKLCKQRPSTPIFVLTNKNCSFFTKWFYKIGIKQIINLPCERIKLKKTIEEHMVHSNHDVISQSIPPPTCTILEQFLGDSFKIVELKKKIYHYSQTDTPLLLTGESGTGKSYLARLIHELSPRKNRSFYAVNMTSISVSIAEAELFGTVKGAYTDAVSREGFFSIAQFGTLFLDEIGDLPIAIQPKLLHVIEEQCYTKVGSPHKVKCNTRFIFATNANLQLLVEQGLFRSDLFHRIAILPVEVPPLRERKTDIPQLAQHFLKPYKKDLSSDSIQKLMDHHWPGNVRELKNCLVRASILSSKEMIPEACISF